MHYSEKERIAFAHFPRTGGTSIIEFLKETFPDLKELFITNSHENLVRTRTAFWEKGMSIYDYKIIVSMRNPLDYMVSTYHFWKDNDFKNITTCPPVCFHDFVSWYINAGLWNYKYYLFADGVLLPNIHIIYFENIEKDLSIFLNIDVKLPHLKKSNHEYFLTYYDVPDFLKVIEYFEWVYRKGYFKIELESLLSRNPPRLKRYDRKKQEFQS